VIVLPASFASKRSSRNAALESTVNVVYPVAPGARPPIIPGIALNTRPSLSYWKTKTSPADVEDARLVASTTYC